MSITVYREPSGTCPQCDATYRALAKKGPGVLSRRRHAGRRRGRARTRSRVPAGAGRRLCAASTPEPSCGSFIALEPDQAGQADRCDRADAADSSWSSTRSRAPSPSPDSRPERSAAIRSEAAKRDAASPTGGLKHTIRRGLYCPIRDVLSDRRSSANVRSCRTRRVPCSWSCRSSAAI